MDESGKVTVKNEGHQSDIQSALDPGESALIFVVAEPVVDDVTSHR